MFRGICAQKEIICMIHTCDYAASMRTPEIISVGKKIGSLEVLSKNGYRKHHLIWSCRCDCGRVVDIFDTNIKRGLSTMCSACGHSKGGKKNRTHGRSIWCGQKYDKAYAAWCKMKRRCLCKTSSDYYLYGGRGIRVHREWELSFTTFLRDVGEPPSPKHSIDRIDNSGNYEPGNVKWSTPVEQANNKRNNRKVLFNGNKISIALASSITGLHRSAIRSLSANYGATVEEMVSYRREKRYRNESFNRWKNG